MLARLLTRWKEFLARQKLLRELSPRAFRDLAGEIRELAAMAGVLGPQEGDFQARVRRIKAEMDQLAQLASRQEFTRLSTERRLELRESLLTSRKQLLDTVNQAPTPTSRLQ